MYVVQVATSSRDSQLVQMNHANYITMLYNWHLKFTKSILTQLESRDYMELRTLLEVLVRVVNHFPILRSHGMHLQKRMEKIQNHEQRGDIPDYYEKGTLHYFLPVSELGKKLVKRNHCKSHA